MKNIGMKRISTYLAMFALVLLFGACDEGNGGDSEFTGNEIRMELIPGTVSGNTTSGSLVIRERTDGNAQLDITLNNILSGAEHPVHLHFGSLEDNGEVATFLTTIREVDGVGQSSTILTSLDNDTQVNYSSMLTFNGSIKIHFEASGPLEDEILGSTNVGMNAGENAAYLNGTKSITTCNSNF
ncbi:MAG: hypothetical protein Roseis2KO_39350 [Roseivirga sp.]